MAKQGWISIYRGIQTSWLWDEKPFTKGQAWIDLLLLANYQEKKFLLGNETIEVNTGDIITSEVRLSARWGWSRTKVRSFLSLLEKEHMITQKKDSKKTAINIVNYSKFQDTQTAKKQQKDSKKTAKEQQKDTNNKVNKENNENKVNKLTYSSVPELNDVLIAFIEFRKKIKKPMTEQAVKLLISKLNKMTDSIDEQIEILNQSIMNGWQSVYPLKEDRKCANGTAKKPDDGITDKVGVWL